MFNNFYKPLEKYQDCNFVKLQKVKVFYTAILAILLIIPFSYYYTVFLVKLEGSRIIIAIGIDFISALIALFILIKGYFSISAHFIFIMSLISVWLIMFSDNIPVLERIDSISYILALLSMTPLIITKHRFSLIMYFIINYLIFLIFVYHFLPQIGVTKTAFASYLGDNTMAFFFIGVTSYLIFTISRNALKKAESETQKNIKLNKNLEIKITERTLELKKAHKEIVKKAHKAGMADIAINILHNVGNILNSVKVSTQVMNEVAKKSKTESLKQANEMLRENMDTLEEFISKNPKGKKLMQYYLAIGDDLTAENLTIKGHLSRLNKKINSIEEVITAQQKYADTAFFFEEFSLSEVIENTLTLMSESFKEANISVSTEFKDQPKIKLPKTKFVHILNHLLKNAVESMTDTPEEQKAITLSTDLTSKELFVRIRDSGHGIEEENLKKIFARGYTNKKEGQGFGLHNSANYTTEMGGKIWAESNGVSKGTTFVLCFPHSDTPQEYSK